MGRTWFDVDGTKKGGWTVEEDQKLVAYIKEHGICDWRSLPRSAESILRSSINGAQEPQRCGKSCRLRWLNYLRPGIRRGKFTPQEEEDVIKLHALLGNRWAAIAKQMQNRTDNDIKNHWNSCLKKRLSRKGIDPMTHEPIIKHITTNEDCGSSSTTTSPSIESSPSSGSARLLNKLAAGISSRQPSVDRIKYILSNPLIRRSSDQVREKEEERKSNMDQKIDGGGEDDKQMWDAEEVRCLMEIDVMEYEMTSYHSIMYESTHIPDRLF